MNTFIFVVLMVTTLSMVVTIRTRLRFRRLAARRTGESVDTFRASFRADEVPDAILRAVYSYFQSSCPGGVPDFPVRAADGLAVIYGLADEEVDDAITQLLADCGRQLPSEEVFRCLGPVIINTVGDLAIFISACPTLAKA